MRSVAAFWNVTCGHRPGKMRKNASPAIIAAMEAHSGQCFHGASVSLQIILILTKVSFNHRH